MADATPPAATSSSARRTGAAIALLLVGLLAAAPEAAAFEAAFDTVGGVRPAAVPIDLRLVVTIPCDEALRHSTPQANGDATGAIQVEASQLPGVTTQTPPDAAFEAQACLVPSVESVTSTLRLSVAFTHELPGLVPLDIPFTLRLAATGTAPASEPVYATFTVTPQPLVSIEVAWSNKTLDLAPGQATNLLTITNRGNVPVEVAVIGGMTGGLEIDARSGIDVAAGKATSSDVHVRVTDPAFRQGTVTFQLQAKAPDGSLGAPVATQFLARQPAPEVESPALAAPLLALAALAAARRRA